MSKVKSFEKKSVQRDVERADPADTGSNGIRAMVVGLAILQALGAARRPLPLRDVASASGMTPSRVHRYLASLTQSGFVRQDERSGHYELGQAVVELGLLALGQLEPIRIGTRALRAFSEASGLDAHLSVWGSAGPTVIRWVSGRLGDQLKIDEGRILPILWSATGRVLMAYRPLDEIVQQCLGEAAHWNEAHPDHMIDARDIEAICAAVRDNGMASLVPSQDSKQEPLPIGSTFPRPHRLQLETSAVPIFDYYGRVAMAITVFGASHISLHDPKANYIEQLREAGVRASWELGYR